MDPGKWKDFWKWKWMKEKKPKKDQLFVLILVGILLLVIAIPVDNKKGRGEGILEEKVEETFQRRIMHLQWKESWRKHYLMPMA